jgi:hypothetical protein
MDLTLAAQAYQQGVDGGAEIICKNMFPVQKPTTDGYSFQLESCPGLGAFVDLGAAVRGMIATPGLFNGDIIAVAGTNVIRIDSSGTKTTIGTVGSTGEVTMAASRLETAICVPPKLYMCDGSTVTEVTDSDLPDVYSVAYVSQRFVMSDMNDRQYWTDLLDGDSIVGTNFSTAESHPDKLVRVFSDGEKFYSMGTVSIETMGVVTNPTSDSNAFARLGSGVIRSGLAGIHAVAVDVSTKTLAFLGNERVVYITQGYDPTPISTPYIDEVLANAAEADIEATRCFSYTERGETFFVMTVPNTVTFVFGKRSGKWHVRETFGNSTWRADQYVSAFGNDYVASSSDSAIWIMETATRTDVGLTIQQEFSASAAVRSVNSVQEITVDGYASTECKINMRKRKPGKKRIWSSYVQRDMLSPDQSCLPQWRRMGKTFPPEEVFQFQISDPAFVVVTGVRANDGISR